MDQDGTWDGGRPWQHCIRCGPSYPRKKGTPTSTKFLAHVYCGQVAGWMTTLLGTEADLGPGHIVLDGVPAPAKGAQQPPLFGPCILWQRSPISATAELLLWSPYGTGQTIIFLPCRLFYLLFFFPRLISAVAHWMSAILQRMVWR